MNMRAVEPGRGWLWLVEGFRLFRRNPLVWIALVFAALLIWILSFTIPLLGPLLFNLFSPVLLAGLMLGCRALDRGENLEINHLFAGFKTNPTQLVTIGGVYMVGTIVIVGIIFATAGGAALAAVLAKSPGDVQAISAALKGMALSLTIGFALQVPLLMLIWFAPLLVIFKGLTALDAMKLSFAACLANMMAFTVYGLIVLGLWFIASIPLFLGLIVLLPVMLCSIYTSYRDIFEPEQPPPSGAAPVP